MRRHSGFTLVEALVVLAIIAGMVGLLIPAVQRVRAASRKSGCLNNVRQLSLAAQQQRDLSSEFPIPGESWTVTLLQWMEERPLMETIRAGNSDATVELRPPLYRCPSQTDIGEVKSCHYVLELGRGSSKKRSFSFSDLPLGSPSRPWLRGLERQRRQPDDNNGPHSGLYNRI